MNEQKTKAGLTRYGWSRALAFVLCLILVPLGICSILLHVYGVENNWTNNVQESFYESEVCRSMAYRTLNNLGFYYRYTEPGSSSGDYDPQPVPTDSGEDTAMTGGSYTLRVSDYSQEAFDPKYVNFLYQVKDSDGNIIAQNCNGEPARLIIEDYDVAWIIGAPNSDAGKYSVSVWVRSPMVAHDVFYWAKQGYDTARTLFPASLPVGALSILLALALFIFLMVSAGMHRDSQKARPGWQEKIPLDLYLLAAIGLCCLSVGVAGEAGYVWNDYAYWLLTVTGLGFLCLLFETLILAACMTIVARLKMGRYFYQHTITYYVVRWCWRLLVRFCRWVLGFLGGLNTVWKTAVITAGVCFLNLIFAIITAEDAVGLLLILLLDAAVFVGMCVAAKQLRALKKAGEELARGNMEYKTDTTKMLPDFKEHGENLNNIGNGLNAAVSERMKSERFKTELITNVSHDIKTPLTSIISYVDLLKREDIENEKAGEYIEVLDRQSQRLKKLTEDLVEASKASSGSISVNMTPTNVGELLSQAVGEYSDRLRKSGVEAVVTAQESDIIVSADGKLLWRVFDNLLSNICKYSMPGTRAYISVSLEGERVDITFRNISARPLNISAEELMERFVRGDSSRSTEGSGLGLNIARSLTELMAGNLFLAVDGDLFKAIVSFGRIHPAPEPEAPEAAL